MTTTEDNHTIDNHIIDNHTIDNHTIDTPPILCIPRVKAYIHEDKIRSIFNALDMGIIERIDIKTNSYNHHNHNHYNKERYNRVFIHYKSWNNTENANIARERLSNGKDIKVIYEDPWFWKITACKSMKKIEK
jgi:hypothetical protein